MFAVRRTQRLKERGQENKGDEASIDRPHDDSDEDDGSLRIRQPMFHCRQVM